MQLLHRDPGEEDAYLEYLIESWKLLFACDSHFALLGHTMVLVMCWARLGFCGLGPVEMLSPAQLVGSGLGLAWAWAWAWDIIN